MDVYGKALLDYYHQANNEILLLHNSYGEPEEMPLDVFFRQTEDMPDLELQALALCKGKVLDVGAGAGCHSLVLQERGFDVQAIDISKGAVELMQERGLRNVHLQDFFNITQKFDTLLFMMNGIGLCGSLDGLNKLLDYATQLLNPNGQLLFDSSDIAYLYEGLVLPSNQYFGEISFCYEYQGTKGEWFNWLYIDPLTLAKYSQAKGWKCEIVFRDDQDQYLARLSR